MTKHFKQTCDKPYDRHHYKIVCHDKEVVVESWQEVQEFWWYNKHLVPPVVHVLDVKKKSKGFK